MSKNPEKMCEECGKYFKPRTVTRQYNWLLPGGVMGWITLVGEPGTPANAAAIRRLISYLQMMADDLGDGVNDER